ncbi:unnamed protein product [Paramecium pentaurelia]|uniref:Uncharacterized protein n=1 Tax=Paramecium pentaurelia TaxID=43138 RepID=A0A8S1S8W3_9CILI|nr:unnamed protein product [Paramecium pentaurelia]
MFQPNLIEKDMIYTTFNWDYANERFIYSKLIIILTQQKEIQYIKNGAIIRIDTIKDISKTPQVLHNFQQIKYLQWCGKYGLNDQKVGKWFAKWNCETIIDVGGIYSDDGKKQGLWKEMIKNYWIKAQAYEIGQYVSDLRNGTWKQIYEDKEIGGGDYNKQGQKEGKWKEFWDGFWHYSQVFYLGEYQNGNKVGRWDILCYDEIIGGGLYDKGIKLGYWIEVSDRFYEGSYITHKGQYKNGQKVGRWDICYQNKHIGGGSYEEGIKDGNWVEVSDEFQDSSQITYEGEYKKGKQIGKWNILFEKIVIGGGSYDGGIKIGNWVEVSDEFSEFSQVTVYGEYKNGQKDGKWDICYKEYWEKNAQSMKIGGGLYDEGIKSAKWVEVQDRFQKDAQVFYNGEYKNNKKVGRWDIFFQNTHIGGGQYDEGIKVGNWIELSDEFRVDSQVKYIGEYKNGKKIGKWEIMVKDEWNLRPFYYIGGGLYDEEGEEFKLGKWVDVADDKWFLTYTGEYQNGKKVGIWVEIDIYNNKNLQIGEKNYEN